MEISLDMDLIIRAGDHNRFTFALYKKLNNTQNNLVISPYAIDLLMAMVFAGAGSTTTGQMKQALQYSQDTQILHTSFAQIQGFLKSFQESYPNSLLVANSLWPQENTPFLASYKRLLHDQYGAAITPLDYIRPEKARETINAWVDEKTHHKINNLIPIGGLNPGARLVLASAAYFNGAWFLPFDTTATHTAVFYSNGSDHMDVPMMHQKGKFRYGEIEKAQILELPYNGNQLSLILILPVKENNLQDVENELDSEVLSQFLNETHEEYIDLFLPRFEISSQILLCPRMSALGMAEAFTENADFSGMNGYKWLYISACLHKALLHVNESGENPISSSKIVSDVGESQVTKLFRADHPFLFLICENLTGSILFIGRLVKPQDPPARFK